MKYQHMKWKFFLKKKKSLFQCNLYGNSLLFFQTKYTLVYYNTIQV